MRDSFRARTSLQVGSRTYEMFSLPALRGHDVSRLPFSLKIPLENLLRFEDGVNVTSADIEALLQWDPDGENAQSLGLTGREVLNVTGANGGNAEVVTVTASPAAGTPIRFDVRVRIDTPKEREYFRHGGILHYVLRQLATGKAA